MTGTASSATIQQQQRRVFGTHEPKWQRFIPNNANPGGGGASSVVQQQATTTTTDAATEQMNVYQRQYSHVYHQRLQQLGPRCWKNIPTDNNQDKDKDSNNGEKIVKVSRIIELEENVLSYVVGTLVVQQNSSVEINESGDNDNEDCVSKKDLAVLLPGCKCHDTNVLYLEDDSGRVALSMIIGKQDDCGDSPTTVLPSTSSFTTGVVVAVKGTVSFDGVLQVQAFYPPAPLLQPPLLLPPPPGGENYNTTTSADAPHLLLVSGLHCASPHSSSLPREMLLSFLQGRLRHPLAKNVCRVVVAGGSLSPAVPLSSSSSSSSGKKGDKNKSSSSSTTVDMVEALRELDAWLLRLVVAGCPVDIMPGKSDPTSANWPQRPLHHSLVQHTSRMADRGGNNKSLFYRAPNPYACRHAGQWVVGTDGTNVHDLVQRLKFTPSELASSSSYSSPELVAMEKNIQWAHLCPNGPSSVPTVPHAEKDPMVLEQEQPRLYFAGNCQQFATKMMTLSSNNKGCDNNDDNVVSTRLVCVPAFSETGQAVLVNLETMDVQVLKFEE